MELRTSGCSVAADERTGALASFWAAHRPDQEFLIADHARQPLFVVQYLDDRRLREISSSEAGAVTVERGDGLVRIAFEDVGALRLRATATIRALADEPALHFGLTIGLGRPAPVLNVQRRRGSGLRQPSFRPASRRAALLG
jgi:hypothetical protein